MRHSRLACTVLTSVTLACVASCDCGPRIRSGDDDMAVGPDMGASESSGTSTSTGDASQTATSVGSGSGHEPIRCPEGEVQCGHECADLRWSEDHCGSCDHACKHNGVGECWEGMCPPTSYCGGVEDGYATCSEVCAAYGESCVDGEPAVPSACGGERYILYYGIGEFDCENGYWASAIMMGGCDDPIQWDFEAGPNGGMPPGEVACCCTQP